ncbi:hypothetical protein K437DRAFT_226801 [Tilletiaria anomala UBC 951]|uniref:Uncharacterized protein n=1 Tax=Tilletiaria anomala (strain ATCC 24038 / CBS 436.72 / UBC 951) TaxID=1037660 RepID=A0A066VIY8_TILAU|nr:uncharacterized protein K437DRAFT_226801 [Tilletiaria anomala UBC 951]KDN41441.1 hypothetical protein K437DRAFT_226801 [Tilletiaria anomala UBC 951]
MLRFRFEAFGRRIININKFHEGIYSDLRNLRSGDGSVCEQPRSPFLQVLHAYNAVNTRKQQKVFKWDHTPHDRLFLAQLDRDLERQTKGLETVSVPVAEPALSFTWDASKSLLEQLGYEKTRAAVTNVKDHVVQKAKSSSRRVAANKSMTHAGLHGLVLGVYNTPAFALSAIGANK